jgi:hypothetical protein
VPEAEPRLQRAALLAGVAEGVVATALPLLAANLTHDPLLVAGVIAAQHLPWILVSLAWPAVARADRRTLVGLVHTVRALAVGYLGFLAVGGFETIHKIEAVAFIVGMGEALTGTVEEETGDSSLGTRGMLGLALVGMPLGGFLYEIFLAVPFLLDVLFFALAALFALFVPRPVTVVAVLRTGRPRLASGTLFVTVTALVASVARSAVLGVLVLFALQDLGLGAPAFGLLLAGIAAGAAVGAWIAPEAGVALGLRPGFAVASAMSAAALVTATKVADPATPILGAAALGIAWAAATTATVLLRALVPVAAGRPVVGDGLRAFHLVEWAGVCAGALLGGWVGRSRGVGDAIVWAAGAWIVAAISVAAVRRSTPAAAPAELASVNWLDAA